MAAPARSIPPDAADCAARRIEFLTAGDARPDRVRATILASWRRSRDRGIAADRVEVPYLRDPDIDTPLTRTAEPVLARLSDKLAGQAVSIILTDAAGLVLGRRTLDAEFERRLDSVLLAPGFSYAEQYAGTNGIGTALESGTGTQVLGHEHYAEDLEVFACAAVPIHDPLSGRLLGVLDLTCRRADTDSLLLTLAETTAEQIEQALLATSQRGELALLHAYRQACRRTAGPVLALAGDTVTLNEYARAELDLADQAALLAEAAEIGRHLAPGRRRSQQVTLPTGRTVRAVCLQVDPAAGLIVQVRPRELPTARTAPAAAVAGLVGDAPQWRRTCANVTKLVRNGSWLVLAGEPGTGKLALLRAIVAQERPGARVEVLEAADLSGQRGARASVRVALKDSDAVIIAHADALTPAAARTLADALHSGDGSTWVALTVRTESAIAVPGRLLELFPHTVDVPPLRVRVDDLRDLVNHFLGRGAAGLSCSGEAMRVLLRASWPGNVAQLVEVIDQLRRHRRSGTIDVDDLPPEVHAISRRVLTAIESIERDAIVDNLAHAHGNKVQAAQALGISRATIYRKIREYGIVGTN